MIGSTTSQERAAFTSGRLDIVQVLRFVAASAVVVAHSESRLARVFPDLAPSTVVFALGDVRTWGHFGVDLFFAISGFIMVWVTRGLFQRPGASREFLIKRTVRVVPIYWLLTSLAVGLLAVAPELFSYRESTDPAWILASYLFVPWQAPEGFVAPVIGLGWTLNFEMYFYACFALALVLPARRAVALISGFFIACAAVGTIVEVNTPWLSQATSWLLAEFVLGMWVARFFLENATRAARIGRVLGPIAAVVLLATIVQEPATAETTNNNGLRLLLWGLPSAGVLWWALSRPWQAKSPTSRVAVALGDASYSIYLLQVFALPALGLAFRWLGMDALPFDALVFLMAALSVACGYLFYAWVERPLTRILNRRVRIALAR